MFSSSACSFACIPRAIVRAAINLDLLAVAMGLTILEAANVSAAIRLDLNAFAFNLTSLKFTLDVDSSGHN